jgi:hypothetical protein
MIQGCRYLRRSTDRWFPSKNSTTRLKDSRIWCKPVCCEIIRYPLHTSRACIYTLVLIRLRVDYEYNIKCLNQCSDANVHLVHAINSFFPRIRPRHHVFPKISPSKAQTASLPNDGALPTASILYRFFWETFPSRMAFITKLGPQVSLSPVPFFGVNICPFNYGIKVILFRNWPQTLDVSKSNLFNTSFSFSSPLESPLRSKP